MSSSVSWLYDSIPSLLLTLVIIWIGRKIAFSTQSKWFPYVMYFCTKDEFPPLEEVKRAHFASLKKHVSHDPQLRKENAIKILEIGVGTGVNFAHYPDGCRLTVVDPNLNFKKYYNENRKKFRNILSEDILVTTGDDMHMVKDNSIDIVVITLVLCSIDKIEETLQEVRRVLAPGGKFYFMEHIREFDLKKHSFRRKLQDFFTWLGLWAFVFDGCELNRDPLPLIQNAGFKKVEAQRYYAPVPNFLFWVEKPNLKGVATK